MKYKIKEFYLTSYLVLFIFLFGSCSKDQLTPSIITLPNSTAKVDSQSYNTGRKTNPAKVLMHYMPWFEKNSSPNGKWGLHWTMATKDPNLLVEGYSDRRQIASFYYPLIGAYHSGDPEVIEYHLLLMKYSGVDAAVIDWYGTHDVYDYKVNFENSDQFIKKTNEVGLEFGMVYEPNVNSIVENITGQNKSLAAIDDLNFLKGNYFNQGNYLKINNESAFLVFGNNFTGPEWNAIFKSSGTMPRTYFLQNLANGLASINPSPGEFFWVNSTDMGGQKKWDTSFIGPKISGAYPGFKDYYIQGGWTTNHLNWEIEVSSATLRDRLNFLKSINSSVVQIQTFNDFGEGTMMEPTVEFGFSFLNELQKFTGSPYTTKELELIHKYYLLRTKYKSTVTDAQAKEIYAFLIAWKVAEAEKLIIKFLK
jgi:hypothetical protein